MPGPRVRGLLGGTRRLLRFAAVVGSLAAAASHVLAGRLDEAQKLMAHMRARDPALRVSNLKDLFPLRRPQDFARWSQALHKAGLPA
jgi:hypothetical protein